MGVLDNTGLQRLWSHIQAGFGDLQAQINNLTITGDYVPLTRKINNKELSEDITLNASDIGAVSSSGQTASRVMISNASGNVAPSAITTTELGYLDGATSNIQTQLDKQLSLAAIEGTNILDENIDLNTTAFLSVGSYYCSNTTRVATFSNCPTKSAFIMYVYSPISYNNLGHEATNTWVYRLRHIIDVTGAEYTQYVHSESTAGEFIYKNWAQIIKTNTKLITDSQNYGSTLPSTGIEGQIFFKKVT